MSRSPSWPRKVGCRFCTEKILLYHLILLTMKIQSQQFWVINLSYSLKQQYRKAQQNNHVQLRMSSPTQVKPDTSLHPRSLQKLKSNKEWLKCRAPNNYRQLQAHYFICNEHKKKQLKRNVKLMMQPISGSSGNSLQSKQFSLQCIQPLAQR